MRNSITLSSISKVLELMEDEVEMGGGELKMLPCIFMRALSAFLSSYSVAFLRAQKVLFE